MTLNDPFPKKPRPRTQVWLTRSCYSQNIPRTMASLVNEWGSSPVGGDQTLWEKWTRRPVSRVLCRPAPKRRTRRPFLWTAPRGTVLATYPGPSGLRQPCPDCSGRGTPIRSCSWRGLPCRPCCQARGGLLPHPFTLPSPERGGLLSVALSLGSPPAGVTRRHVVVEPGLSSTSLRRPRPPGRLVRAEGGVDAGRGQPPRCHPGHPG